MITNRRVMQVGGVINKHSTDSSLEKINDAALSQSSSADVLVRRPRRPDRVGERDRRFRMIQDPISFKRAMLDAR